MMEDKLLMSLDSNSSQYYSTKCRDCDTSMFTSDEQCYECGSYELETEWDYFEQDIWEQEKEYMASLIGDGEFELTAVSSNWRGQDGYAHVDNSMDAIDKALSFGGSYIALWEEEDGNLFFRTASHDVPTGFIIRIQKV